MNTDNTKDCWIAGLLDCWLTRRHPFIHASSRPAMRLGFWRLIYLVTCYLSLVTCHEALANPTGMTVASGTATASQNGSQLTITTSPIAFLNWQSFNIAAGETTLFNQPSISSVVVNRINDQNPSQIFGSLQANGIVVLMNSSGFYFGPNSYVKTGGLIVSTANCIPPQNTGGSWQFNGPPPLSSIINFGKIDVAPGGPAYLIAENVFNYGSINAPGGDVGLAAGQQVLLSQRPDGRGLSMQVNLPDGSVDNYGHITADAGTIAMNARTVNQNGFVQANSVRNVNGVIELVASDKLNLGANSQILANGDNSAGGSSGGNVTLQSDNVFSDATGSQIDVRGGSQGGDGGNVEISAPNILSLNSSVDAGAQTGWSGGTFALDPVDMVLGTVSSSPPDNNGTIDGTSGSGVFYVDVNNEFQNITAGQILLNASGNIYVGDGVVNSDGSFTPENGVTWDLTGSAGGLTGGNLSLQAGGDISFVDGSLITDANSWSVTLKAGVNNFTTGSVQPGVGNIYLNGGSAGDGIGGSIQTAAGNIKLVAGQDITVGSGYVITTGGGSISAHALAGNIDTGSDAQGYHFVGNASSLNAAYNLQNGLGGISTAAGGDVTLIAGGDVTSVLPSYKGYYYDGTPEPLDNVNGNDYLTAGSGAYGSQPGNVTIVAGGDVTGHYLVANGTGSIFAGVGMDANGNPVTDSSGNYLLGTSGSAGTDQLSHGLALSLISGGWNVAAAQNILLEEVRNPNGVFNNSGAYSHYFNYAPGDYVNLSAGNMVQLGAAPSQLPRLSQNNLQTDVNNVPIIYPSILNITAGAGGVILGTGTSPNSLTLFPSPQGGLTIDTAGSLVNALNVSGPSPQLFNLIVSDAGHNQYTTTANFGISDHAASPIHADSSTPINLNIGGDMADINLVVPEAAQINVGGNMNNCAFQGMNVSSDPSFQFQILEADGNTRTVTIDPAVTSINVVGDIFNRGNFTSVNLSQIPGAQNLNLSYLAQAVNDPATLATSFFYDPATQTLTYENINGRTLLSVLQELSNLKVYSYDANGNTIWDDPPYDTIQSTKTVSVFGNPTPTPGSPATIASLLYAQYNNLGAPPVDTTSSSSIGYTVGGGGQFNITARSIDLGTSAGIQSEGVALYTVRGSYPLASLFGNGGVFNKGANISVTTTGNHSAGATADGEPSGDLDMYSSSIASLNGGSISVNAGADVNTGSSVFTVNTSGATGIYSTSGGDVSVIASGDVNVNGSRITTYDDGNITVESLDGSVNAGTGASQPVGVTGYYEDPVAHAVYFTQPQIPFSGITALTFPARSASYPAPPATLGNILVEAPNGNITASSAGILQIALNNLNYPNATTTILAGYELRDNLGNPVTAADLADGTPALVSAGRNINVSGSGIIAGNANLDASGNINGLIFARNNLNINAQQNINVTALGLGNVNVSSSGGTISGTLIGVNGVNASGSSVDASLISANVTGATSGQSGLGQGAAANATSQGLANNESTQAAAASDQGADEEKKKKGKEIALAQKVSRVTVILPPKKVSETKTSTPGT
jgi:filamentous hemagglutinin family protein